MRTPLLVDVSAVIEKFGAPASFAVKESKDDAIMAGTGGCAGTRGNDGPSGRNGRPTCRGVCPKGRENKYIL
jgi:hypothetical protein